MRIFLRFFLFSFILLTQGALAQKLYWVGGSGNFNDPAHWSLQSGGTGGAKSPGATDDVYFDENSFLGESVISFIGNTQVHDFIFAQYTPKVVFQGLQHEKITIGGNVQLNSYIDNRFAGDIYLTSSQPSTSVSFALTQLKGNLYFNGSTIWLLPTDIIGNDNATIYFKQGTFNLSNTSISCGNMIASAGVIINSNQTTYRVSNKFVLPAGVVFNDTKSIIQAYTKDPVKFQVSNTINFNNSSRLNNLNNVMSSCNVTLTNATNPTCPGSCNGVLTFNIPASCSSSSNPIWVIWHSGCTSIPTASLTPGSTYTIGGLCGCASLYKPIFTNDTITQDSTYNPATVAGIAVADPSPPQEQSFNNTSFKPTCFGLCNGKIIMTVSQFFGTAPIQSTWTLPTGGTVIHNGIGNTSNSNNKDTLKNACAGTYTVSLLDANGCPSLQTYTVNLTQPTKVVSAPTFTNPLCSGVCNGAIQDNPSGGTPPYVCTMDSAGGSGPNLAMPGCAVSGLCAGTYTVFATDAHGCKDTNIVNITPPPPITFIKTPASGTITIPCQSACSGSVSVTNVTGGVAPYTFSWSPAGGTVSSTANSSTYSNLCGTVAGNTYTCTITDANNCVKTAVFMVKAPSALTLTPVSINPKCNATSSGSATVTASGGVSPGYNFTWVPWLGAPSTTVTAGPKSTYSNIPAGTYTAYVTDANGCLDSTSVTLTNPPALTATMTTIVNPTCPNLNNGQLCISASGGTPGPGYTYTWSPSAGTASCTPANLVSGIHTATVTDANGCKVTVSTNLTPPPPVVVSSATTQPTCVGMCNGSATLTPTSGLSPFSYHWSCSGSTLPTISGQCGGTTCNYTVTDANNCNATGSVSFIAPSTLSLSLTTTTITCAGTCNGAITSNASGGTPFPGPVYNYTWTGAGVSVNAQNQNGLCAGNYTCVVSDANGCTQTATTSIAAPTPLSITLTPTNPTCSGLCNGIITTTLTGGTGALTHTWTPNPPPPNLPNSLNLNSLCAGIIYTLNVTDANGCTDFDTLTLISPPPVLIALTTTTINCNGGTGSATVTSSGGSPGYQYNWDNTGFGPLSGTVSTISSLSAGTHTISVEDSHGCLAATQFFNMPQPAPLNVAVKNIVSTCNGLCNGGATANISGGTQVYAYSWDIAAGPFLASDSVISTLCVGTHTLYVKDANGCLASVTFNVSPLVNIAISVSSNTVSCHNACDATGTASASGGLSPYTIQWVGTSTCTAVVSSCTASGLCSGTHTIIAADSLGCSSTTTITIVNPPVLTASVNATSVQCFGQCTGAATVTPSGGTPNPSAPFYTINWNPPAGFSGSTLSNLCPGTYTADILDHNGCALTQTVAIAVSGQFSVTPTYSAPSTCGAGNGGISISISGGSGTYTVAWSPPGGTQSGVSPISTYSNIPAGTYTATITDANGCDTTIVYGLGSPTGPVMNYTVTNASCYGVCDGSATVVATGTNNPIQLTWQGGTPAGTGTITANNLCGNPSTTYSIQATDAIGCITFTTLTITSPTKIVDNSAISEPVCGGSNGTVTLTPSGGSGSGYSYNWNNGALPPNNPETGLSAGIDSVIITDGFGCSQKYTYTLTSTNSPSVSVSTGSITCSYLTNGTATATATGGTPAYSYTWSTSSGTVVPPSGLNISTISNLAAGSYSVLVSDANSCTTQTVFTIVAPAAINPQFVKQDVLCNGGNTGSASIASVSGGNPGYAYSWSTSSNASSISSLSSGPYSVIVSDTNNCTDTLRFIINQPSSMTVSVAATPPTCSGGTNGTATVTVSGGMPYTVGSAYTYTWSTLNNTAIASNLSAGCYTVVVADSNSCTTATITCISSPPPISPNITSANPGCGLTCTGSITSTPSGGTGSTYTYSWSPSGGVIGGTANSSTYSSLCANTYTLVVTDSLNCTNTTTVALNSPTPPSLTYTTSPANCGSSNGSITITGTTGTGTVAINWLNTTCASAPNCTNLSAGIYSVQLTDGASCIDTVSIPLSNSNGPVVAISFTNVTCNGSSTGAAFDTVISTGSSPYTFSWTTVPAGTVTSTTSSSYNSGLAAGTGYIYSVTDALGCVTTNTFAITQPTPINDAPSITSASCFGINNGTIISNGSGGTPFVNGYVYAIDGGSFSVLPSASFTFSNVSAGTHTVCIKDSLNCSNCFTYSITPTTVIVSSIAATNVTCFGMCNATATVSSITGGTPNYVVTWNDPSNQVGTVASNLCGGTYTATITDNVGCTAQDTITIIAPGTINPNAVVNDPTCGQCNGTITIAPTGGNGGAYTYSWTPSGNTPILNNVCAGPYQVEISDNAGCQQTFVIPVSSASSLSVSLTATNPTCGGTCNGVITTTVTGGTSPYTYLWTVGTQTTSSISNQCSGNYIVEVKDSMGCINTQSVTITAPSTFTINTTNTPPGCGLSNGIITTTVVGSSTYSYLWSANAGSATTPNVNNLAAGVYTLVVTDIISHCSQNQVIILNNNAGPSLSIAATPASCYGLCNGTATVTITGGTPTVTVVWNTTPSQSTTTATNLCGDSTYIVQVTGGAGCIQTEQITITQPTKLTPGLSIVSPIKCNNDNNGAINVVVYGGTPLYTYSWTPSTISGAGGSNLSPGNYSVTVTDANGCPSVQLFDTLTNPPALSLTGTVTPATCNNVANGAIATTTSGGTPTYAYQWNGGSTATTASLTAILPGTYTVHLTDSRGCKDSANFTVISTVSVTANAGRDTFLCNNVPIVLTGTVTGAVSFDWQTITGTVLPPPNTLTLSVNPATTTQYVLLAVNGVCTYSDTVTVSIAPAAMANAGPSQSIFIGQTATIGGNPSNPSGGTIVWYPNTTLSDSAISNPIASPSVTTIYTVTVTNTLGCKATDTMVVTILPPFIIPTGFTPNGDGKNDAWVIDNMNLFPNVEIEVYNRWGEQLFYSKGNYTPWTGTYNGKPVPVGTYYYIIRLNDPKYPDHYAGPLTILR